MEYHLAQDQKNLIHGLKLFGCSELQTIVTIAQLWHPDDVAEMLDYMLDHTKATPEELYEMSSKISSRRPGPEEDEEDEE